MRLGEARVDAGRVGEGLVLYLPRLPMGGIERTTLALAAHWVREGRDVTVLLDRAEGRLLEDIRAPLVVLGVSRTAFAFRPLLRFMRRARPRVLHSALPWNNLVALAAGRVAGVAVSVAEHSLMSGRLGVRAGLLPPLMRVAYPWARAILTPSGVVADEVARAAGVARGRIAVVGNPVWAEMPGVARPGNDRPSFVAIGRLEAVKDFATLLRAFRLVLDRGPARLSLMGEGSERGRLEALAGELRLGEAFSMAGEGDAFAALAGADALVVSSRSEGFGNVVVEAMACGVAVISTQCGGPEALLGEGALGALVPVGDHRAMADAMMGVAMGLVPGTIEARREAAGSFTVAKVADRIWAALGMPA